MKSIVSTLTFTTFAAALCLVATITAAQEKQKIKFDVSAAQTKYTYQQVLDVGDIPGHQVRMYDIDRNYGDKGPAFRGIKLVLEQLRGFSDLTNTNGPAWGYSVLTLENGEKIFARYSGSLLSVDGENGMKQTTYNGSGTYVGGTGAFKAIRGTFRSISQLQFKEGKAISSQTENDGEYWFEK